MLITPAYAESAPSMGGFDFMSFLPLILIFVVFYFMLIRPQQKKMKTHQAMLGALRRGDRVITSGGLIGLVTKIVNDQEVQLEIAENTRVRIVRSMISEVLAKGSPLASETESADSEETSSEKKRTPVNRSRASAKGK
jgi:preprotein translocase subunit YajC